MKTWPSSRKQAFFGLPCCPAVVVKASSSSSTATYSSTLIWSSLSTCSSVPMPSKLDVKGELKGWVAQLNCELGHLEGEFEGKVFQPDDDPVDSLMKAGAPAAPAQPGKAAAPGDGRPPTTGSSRPSSSPAGGL